MTVENRGALEIMPMEGRAVILRAYDGSGVRTREVRDNRRGRRRGLSFSVGRGGFRLGGRWFRAASIVTTIGFVSFCRWEMDAGAIEAILDYAQTTRAFRGTGPR